MRRTRDSATRTQCAISIWLLFTPPTSLSPSGAALWFGLTYLLYHLFHTVYLVPHVALGPALTPEQSKAVFGPEIEKFQEYRRKYDPENRFYPEYFRNQFE